MERVILLLIFSGLCLFIQGISSNQPRYVLIHELKNWDDAQIYCREIYFDLATAQNDDDWKNLRNTVQPVSMAWTGLYNDLNSWRWSYQDEKITFNSWKSAEPDNADGKQECCIKESGGWNDRACTDTHPFFCYNESVTASDRFVLINTAMTWTEAQIYCRQHYTDLATVRSQAENYQLGQMMQTYNEIWIGLFRDSWKWSDGFKVASKLLIHWMLHQPDMTFMERPCGAVVPLGQIDDQSCLSTLPFICETLVRKQILKLEVKSDQNLNDPVVMGGILLWIKQKLTVRGIEKDTTLTWRIQPNGNIFRIKSQFGWDLN